MPYLVKAIPSIVREIELVSELLNLCLDLEWTMSQVVEFFHQP